MAAPEQAEIKVNIGGDTPGDVERALARLGLGAGTQRETYFAEDGTPGLASSHPLLDAGVILRIRVAGGSGDSTVKLRPCRRSQLVDPWSRPRSKDGAWSYRIEADWSGVRRTLAASLVDNVGPRRLVRAVTRPWEAFDQRQRQFLAACAGLPVNLNLLTVRGPVITTRWELDLARTPKVTVERWQVGAQDFLELSIRADVGKAAAAQDDFHRAVGDAGLPISGTPRAKTELVLDLLAA